MTHACFCAHGTDSPNCCVNRAGKDWSKKPLHLKVKGWLEDFRHEHIRASHGDLADRLLQTR